MVIEISGELLLTAMATETTRTYSQVQDVSMFSRVTDEMADGVRKQRVAAFFREPH
jgi:hypothetical protein